MSRMEDACEAGREVSGVPEDEMMMMMMMRMMMLEI